MPLTLRTILLVALLLLAACASAEQPLLGPPGHGSWNQSPGYFSEPPLDAAQIERLRAQLLDLEPDRDNRQLIEQAREAEEAAQGIDVTEQEWIELDVEEKTLLWGGRVQGDWVAWPNDQQFGGQSNYFEFRRLRLQAEGHGYGVFDYRVELEFSPNVPNNPSSFVVNGVSIRDVYLNARDVPLFGQLRMGNTRVPIGLEQLTASGNLTFIERGLTTDLLPGRDLGIVAYNHTAIENGTLAAGVFTHDFSNTAYAIEDDSHGFRLAGRATYAPYYDHYSEGRYAIHTGLGYVFTQPRRQTNVTMPAVAFYPVEFDARPEINRGDHLVETGNLNVRRFHVANAEAALIWGPFSMQAEAAFTRVNDFNLGTIDLYGSYVYASYFLTGENRNYKVDEGSFGGLRPFENFWIVDTCSGPQAGWGAWEVAARWSYLDFSDVANQQLNNLTVGVNWYWNQRTRCMFNWIHPFAHRSPAGIGVNPQGDILAARMEFEF